MKGSRLYEWCSSGRWHWAPRATSKGAKMFCGFVVVVFSKRDWLKQKKRLSFPPEKERSNNPVIFRETKTPVGKYVLLQFWYEACWGLGPGVGAQPGLSQQSRVGSGRASRESGPGENTPPACPQHSTSLLQLIYFCAWKLSLNATWQAYASFQTNKQKSILKIPQPSCSLKTSSALQSITQFIIFFYEKKQKQNQKQINTMYTFSHAAGMWRSLVAGIVNGEISPVIKVFAVVQLTTEYSKVASQFSTET